jgi:hypothetical protein
MRFKVYYDNRGRPTTWEVVAENREEAIRETKRRLGYRAKFEIVEVE